MGFAQYSTCRHEHTHTHAHARRPRRHQRHARAEHARTHAHAAPACIQLLYMTVFPATSNVFCKHPAPAGTNDMREQNIFEAVASKKSQLFLATQVRARGGVLLRDACASRWCLRHGPHPCME